MIPIEFDAIIFQEGKRFVAHCHELDVSSCGRNVDEARGGLKTAVRLFVEEAEKLGTLEDILKEAGVPKGN
jgi:predicted RNase H-like HicB family nuclease